MTLNPSTDAIVDPVDVAEEHLRAMTTAQVAAVRKLIERVRYLEQRALPPPDAKAAALAWLTSYREEQRQEIAEHIRALRARLDEWGTFLHADQLERHHVEGEGATLAALARAVGRLDLLSDLLASFNDGALAQLTPEGG